MDVAGPSRPQPGRLTSGRRVESTYEDDLLRLLAQLSVTEIDDLQTYYSSRARRGDVLTDQDTAMHILLQNARDLRTFNEDRALAQSLASGAADGGWHQHPPQGVNPTLRHNQHQPVRQDRLGAANPPQPPDTWGKWFSSLLDWIWATPSIATPGTAPTASANVLPTSDTPAANTNARPTGHTCVICQDPIHGSEVRAPCGHYYDIACVTDLFQSATRDESLFPPRCCRQNIPFAQVQRYLTQALVIEFQEKSREFTTLKRVYCADPRCSRFIGPLWDGFLHKIYDCPAPGCSTKTCGKCRAKYEWPHLCKPDAGAEQVLTLSRASGWSRCPGCSQMIELNMGCFHMTCRCKTEFCYVCQARWKTCRCPQWDERQLLAAAEQRVDAQLRNGQVPRNPVPPAQRPAPAPAAPAVRAHEWHPRPADAPVQQVETRAIRRPVVEAQARPEHRIRPHPTPAPPPPPPPAPVVSVPASASKPHLRRTAPVAREIRAGPSILSTSSTANARREREQEQVRQVQNRNWFVGTQAEAVRQRLIREAMERLRVDHDCDHAKWRYRAGGGQCETCHHHLPLYLFRCQGCEMLACNRCRRNRL